MVKDSKAAFKDRKKFGSSEEVSEAKWNYKESKYDLDKAELKVEKAIRELDKANQSLAEAANNIDLAKQEMKAQKAILKAEKRQAKEASSEKYSEFYGDVDEKDLPFVKQRKELQDHYESQMLVRITDAYMKNPKLREKMENELNGGTTRLLVPGEKGIPKKFKEEFKDDKLVELYDDYSKKIAKTFEEQATKTNRSLFLLPEDPLFVSIADKTYGRKDFKKLSSKAKSLASSGYSQSEIAEKLGIPIGSAYYYIYT